MDFRWLFKRALRSQETPRPEASKSEPASEDFEHAAQLQASLEAILGVTSEQARNALGPGAGLNEATALVGCNLCDSYRAVCLKARSDLESAFDAFFDRFAGRRVGVGFLKRTLQEERSQPRNPSAGALLDSIEADLSAAIASLNSESQGQSEPEITAGDLRRLLMKLFRPTSNPGLLISTMTDCLETILRLAPMMRNTLTYALYVEDADGSVTMDESVRIEIAVLRSKWHSYQEAFPPSIRIPASYSVRPIEKNVERIFDESDGRIASWARERLPEPEQDTAISALRRAFATKLLYESDRMSTGKGTAGRIAYEREYLSRPHYQNARTLEALLGAADYSKLAHWLEAAQWISSPPHFQAKATLEERVVQLETRLKQLKSALDHAAGAKSENETLLDGLIAVLLERLVEATNCSVFAQYAGSEDRLVADYCEFLWQKSADAPARIGLGVDAVRGAEAWSRLELMRKLVLLNLKTQSSSISRGAITGWRLS